MVLSAELSATECGDGGRHVHVRWADGAQARFHAQWLRDNDLGPATRDQGIGQRKIRVTDVDADIRVVRAEVAGAALTVTFSTGETSAFGGAWLAEHSYDGDARERGSERGRLPADVALYGAATNPAEFTREYADVLKDDAVLAEWLDVLCRRGVARVTGGRADEAALAELIARFGYVRETNYGQLFDTRATPDPINFANTSLGLQAHTDNPYRNPVPSLQALHCVENSVAGGLTTVVDGFAVAQRLRAEHPQAFALLAGHDVRFRYHGTEGVDLRSMAPLIDVAPSGELRGVRFNNRSIAPIVDVDFDTMPAFYDAYRLMSRIIDDEEMGCRFRLEPGDAVVFINTRTLHARTAFDEGTGSRWLKGCYADVDALYSRRAVLAERHGRP